MYERMLNKQIVPSFKDLIDYCKECGALLENLNNWIKTEYSAETLIRFPYGNDYGWGIKYFKGKKHICDIFAEKGAFTLFMKINSNAFSSIQNDLSDYSKKVYEDKYSCKDGGWIDYRVTSFENINDAKKFINAKIQYKK